MTKMTDKVFSESMASSAWKKYALRLVILMLVIKDAEGQDVELNSEKALKIKALNESSLQVEWKHLIQKGNNDLIEEVELKQKVGKKWNSILTVIPTEPLVVDTFPICKAHQKLTVSITPKLGKECHPYCSSTFSDYKPIQYFVHEIDPYSCVKNSTTLFIQLNDSMVRKDIFSKCIQNVKIYEDGELSKFKGKVTLLDSVTIDIELDESVKFYDLVYEAINLDTEKTSTILSKRLSPKWEKPCDIPNHQTLTYLVSTPTESTSASLLVILLATIVILVIIMVIISFIIIRARPGSLGYFFETISTSFCHHPESGANTEIHDDILVTGGCDREKLEDEEAPFIASEISDSEETRDDNNVDQTDHKNHINEMEKLISTKVLEPDCEKIDCDNMGITSNPQNEESEQGEWQKVGQKKAKSAKSPTSYFVEVVSNHKSPDQKKQLEEYFLKIEISITVAIINVIKPRPQYVIILLFCILCQWR